MSIEIELKFRADSAAMERLAADFGPEYTRIPMETTYYDTPDGALSARHWTLRRRQEGERSVCTLKIPAPGGARGEWELECDDIIAAISRLAELAELPELLGLTAGGVRCSCGAKFLRRAKTIELGEATAELALDSGVLINGARELALSEVELELKSGPVEELMAYGRLFAQKYGLTIEPKSKYARARALGTED